MSLAQFLSILRARWKLTVGVWAVILALAVGLTLLLPKQYDATASIVIDLRPDPLAAIAMNTFPNPAIVATQVDIIQSERVARRVVKELRLAENPDVRAKWLAETEGEGTIEAWLVGSFQRTLTVTPSRDSNVIFLTYTAADPAFAAAMANAFARAYLATTVDLRVSPAREFSSFFDKRVKESRDAMEAAQSKLSAFQKANGIIAADERMDVENARLSELSTQLIAMQAVASDSRSRQAQAAAGAGDRLTEVIGNPVVSGLRADLAQKEAHLQELGARLGDAHPQVVELRANIAETRQRIEAETRRVTGSVGTSSTINNQREAQVRAELEAQRAKVLRMKAVRDEGAVLIRDAENAQRTYDAIQARFNQSSLESMATQSNSNLLTEATAPTKPSKPRVALNLALGAFLGMVLGVGIAIVLELLDRRVRVGTDLTTMLELPLLGAMPKPVVKRIFARRRLPLMERRLLGLAGSGKGH